MLLTPLYASQREFRQNIGNFDDYRGVDMASKENWPEIRFTVSPKLFAYLSWLSQETVLGKKENEVAQQILTTKLSEMKNENFEPND